MTNPIVHAIVFILAIIIPGGLLLYLALRSTSLSRAPKSPTPDEALKAFLQVYPKYPKDSLRARNRLNRLKVARTKRRKKSQ